MLRKLLLPPPGGRGFTCVCVGTVTLKLLSAFPLTQVWVSVQNGPH